MKVRILDVHPLDAWAPYKCLLIGLVGEVKEYGDCRDMHYWYTCFPDSVTAELHFDPPIELACEYYHHLLFAGVKLEFLEDA